MDQESELQSATLTLGPKPGEASVTCSALNTLRCTESVVWHAFLLTNSSCLDHKSVTCPRVDAFVTVTEFYLGTYLQSTNLFSYLNVTRCYPKYVCSSALVLIKFLFMKVRDRIRRSCSEYEGCQNCFRQVFYMLSLSSELFLQYPAMNLHPVHILRSETKL